MSSTSAPASICTQGPQKTQRDTRKSARAVKEEKGTGLGQGMAGGDLHLFGICGKYDVNLFHSGVCVCVCASCAHGSVICAPHVSTTTERRLRREDEVDSSGRAH